MDGAMVSTSSFSKYWPTNGHTCCSTYRTNISCSKLAFQSDETQELKNGSGNCCQLGLRGCCLSTLKNPVAFAGPYLSRDEIRLQKSSSDFISTACPPKAEAEEGSSYASADVGGE